MKEKILEISKRLENNEITEQEARHLFLDLFGVINKNEQAVLCRCGKKATLHFCDDCIADFVGEYM